MTYFSPLRRLSPTVEFIHHPTLDLFSDHRKSLENLSQILVLQNSLKFTFLPSQIFYNFWEFLRFFPIFSVTRISLFIFLNLEINFNGFPFSFLFQPSRPAHSFGLGLPAGPNCPANLATQPLGPRVPLAYFAEDVFFFHSSLPFSAPPQTPLADAWAPLVSSFFQPTPANPGCAAAESRRLWPLRATAPHLEMPP
jgi:hypothetical protein